MDERIVKYQDKMDKTLANLDSELEQSVQEEPILTYLTVSWWNITEHRHRCSR